MRTLKTLVVPSDLTQFFSTTGSTGLYSEHPPRNALLIPWSEVSVDILIGPLKIAVPAQAIESHALNCIDTVTNLEEISLINNKTSHQNILL